MQVTALLLIFSSLDLVVISDPTKQGAQPNCSLKKGGLPRACHVIKGDGPSSNTVERWPIRCIAYPGFLCSRVKQSVHVRITHGATGTAMRSSPATAAHARCAPLCPSRRWVEWAVRRSQPRQQKPCALTRHPRNNTVRTLQSMVLISYAYGRICATWIAVQKGLT